MEKDVENLVTHSLFNSKNWKLQNFVIMSLLLIVFYLNFQQLLAGLFAFDKIC